MVPWTFGCISKSLRIINEVGILILLHDERKTGFCRGKRFVGALNLNIHFHQLREEGAYAGMPSEKRAFVNVLSQE